jgi:hypothetical protein
VAPDEAGALVKRPSHSSAQRAFELHEFLTAGHEVLQFLVLDLSSKRGAQRLSVIEDREPIADRERVTHVVGDEDDTHPLLSIASRALANVTSRPSK